MKTSGGNDKRPVAWNGLKLGSMSVNVTELSYPANVACQIETSYLI